MFQFAHNEIFQSPTPFPPTVSTPNPSYPNPLPATNVDRLSDRM